MKKFVFISIISIAFGFITSCKQTEFDHAKANAICEQAIKLIHNRNYSELSNLYSEDFKTSESPEVRAEKFDRILDVTGAMKSDSLISTTDKVNDEIDELVLTYRVDAEEMPVNESFTIAIESGEYKIAKIDIQQETKNK